MRIYLGTETYFFLCSHEAQKTTKSLRPDSEESESAQDGSIAESQPWNNFVHIPKLKTSMVYVVSLILAQCCEMDNQYNLQDKCTN